MNLRLRRVRLNTFESERVFMSRPPLSEYHLLDQTSIQTIYSGRYFFT